MYKHNQGTAGVPRGRLCLSQEQDGGLVHDRVTPAAPAVPGHTLIRGEGLKLHTHAMMEALQIPDDPGDVVSAKQSLDGAFLTGGHPQSLNSDSQGP